MIKRRLSRGFTLVEILVSVSLLCLAFTAAATFFARGTRLYTRLNSIQVEENTSIFFEKITRDLKNATVYSLIPATFAADSLTFPSLGHPPAGFTAADAFPRQISYRFDKKENSIIRSESGVFFKTEIEKKAQVLSGVRALRFEVFAGSSNLPAKVTISVETSIDGVIRTKSILIPSAYTAGNG